MSSQLSWSDASFSALTRNECWDFPTSSACVTGILYMEWSLPISLPAVLQIWTCTCISVPSLASSMPFGNFFIENFQRRIFLAWFVMQDLCIDCYQVQQMKEKFPPEICLSLKWIMWQHLAWSLHTILVVQHCSWFYFIMCPPWQWCLIKYIFMGSG
jgi:hypothetical protein